MESFADNEEPIPETLFHRLPDTAENTFTGDSAVADDGYFPDLHTGFFSSDDHLLFHAAADFIFTKG